MREGKSNTLGNFFFLAAGLVDLGPEPLNFSNAPKTDVALP